MNFEYLQEPLEQSSPFDIADLYLQENPTYREAVEKGIISREDVALFWAFMKAEHECITAPAWPLDLKVVLMRGWRHQDAQQLRQKHES